MRDTNLGARRQANRAGFLLARLDRIAAHLMRRLGHAIGFDHGRAKGLGQLGHHRPRQRRGRRPQEPQPRIFDDLGVAPSARQDRLMHGWHRRIPCGINVLQPAKELQRIKARRAADGRPRRQRGADGGDQPMDVEERHHVQAPIIRRQRQRGADVFGRCHHIRLQQWHDLWPRRGPRCVQDQRHIIGGGQAVRGVSCHIG